MNETPPDLELGDLGTECLGACLSHPESERGNGPQTRKARFVAICSFFGYVAVAEPRRAALAQRVLTTPAKRYTRRAVDFLGRDEAEALLVRPVTSTGEGH